MPLKKKKVLLFCSFAGAADPFLTIKAGGKPIEVMGLLFGRPNTEEENAFVVTDAFPLPIEGFETRVIADDMDVQNYMISLQETLEELGWRRSHT